MSKVDNPHDDDDIHVTPTPAVIEPGHTFGVGDGQDQRARPAQADAVRLVHRLTISFALMMHVDGDHRASGVMTGIGIWGNNQPVGWSFDIINFVWWIGIGHAGTLISAILLLLRQEWRTSINRFAEAMTLFAVACGGTLSAPAHGATVARLLDAALSRTRWGCGRSFAAR